MFTIIGAIAKLERDIIAERVKSGMRRARAVGKVVGRPKAHVSPLQVEKLRLSGLKLGQIATKLGVSESTLRRVLRAAPSSHKRSG